MKILLRPTRILLLCAFLVFGMSGTSMAYLDGWELDLSGVAGGLGEYTNIDRVNVSGGSIVTQSFGADGVFNAGDTFTEMALLNQIIYYTEPGNPLDVKTFTGISGAGQNMYVYADGLQGTVYDIATPDLSNPGSWTFKYDFTPGVGTIGMYIDDDINPLNGVTATLTEFDIAYGGGIGNPGFLGGAEANGTTNITAYFDETMAGVFFDENGVDLSTLPEFWVLGLLNTNNQVLADTFELLYGDTPTGLAGFTTQINNAGQFNVDVVPEPTTLLLLGLGMLGLAGAGRKKLFNKA